MVISHGPRRTICRVVVLMLGSLAAVPLAINPADSAAKPRLSASGKRCTRSARGQRHTRRDRRHRHRAPRDRLRRIRVHNTLSRRSIATHRIGCIVITDSVHQRRHRKPPTTTSTSSTAPSTSTTATDPTTTPTTPTTPTTTHDPDDPPRPRRPPRPTTTTTTTTTTTGSGGGESSIGGCNGCSWNGDFSTGNLTQYDTPDGDLADFLLLTANPTPPAPFHYAFDAHLDTTSVSTSEAGERTLTILWPTTVASQGATRAYSGATSWYRDEQYFPSSYQPSKDTDFNWTFELHNAPDSAGDDMVSCGVDTSTGTTPGPYQDGGGALSPARYSCRIFGGGNASYPFDSYNSSNWYTNPAVDWTDLIGLKSITPNTWYDMVWQIRWSCAPGQQSDDRLRELVDQRQPCRPLHGPDAAVGEDRRGRGCDKRLQPGVLADR